MDERIAPATALKTLVVNFNAPELNYLAGALAQHGELSTFVRPYLNKQRLWERALARLPLAGRLYLNTFGRRRIGDAQLLARTHEAGVLADLLATALGRAERLPGVWRHRWMNHFQEAVRLAAAREGARLTQEANCVVAYQGFALQAFRPSSARSGLKRVLNYPIAHHRQHRKVREEECRLEPAFASTWLGFEHWPRGYEDELDEEIALADGILVGSSYARDSFIAEGIDAAKLKVVPYGVDFEIFWANPRGAPKPRFEVVYAGQLTQRKGVSYLLRGYQKFQRADSRLTLIGSLVDGFAPFEPYRDLFRHVPHLTRTALADMYRQSSVFVFPTLLEGMGLVVLEAMACGLPVIVTDHGPSDLVRDGVDGFVVPIRDPDAISERLTWLYEDPERCQAMGQSARERARQFGWDSYTNAVRSYLAELVNPISLQVRS